MQASPNHLYWLVLLALLPSCARRRDFRAQLQTGQAQCALDALQAHQCAEDLRSLAERNPVETSRALDDMGAPFVGSAWTVAGRSRSEIVRREKEIEAARTTIAHAEIDGPGSLQRVFRAAERAHHLRESLCRARDMAFALTAMAPQRGSPHAAVVSERTSAARSRGTNDPAINTAIPAEQLPEVDQAP